MSRVTRELVVRGAILTGLAIALVVGVEPRIDRAPRLTTAELSRARSIRVIDDRFPADVRDIVVLHDGIEWVLDLGSTLVPAREDRVTSLLRALEAARATRTVTSRESQFDSFGLGDRAIRLTIDGERLSVRIAVGDDADQRASFYARVEPDGPVVVADGGAAFFARQPAMFWAYLRVFPESVRRSDIIAASAWAVDPTGAVRSWDAYRDDRDRWVTGDAFGDEGQRVMEEWAAVVADLVGEAFVIGDADEIVGDPVAAIGLELSDGRSYRMSLRIDGVPAGASTAATDAAWIVVDGPGLPSERFAIAGYRIGAATVRRIFTGVTD